LRNRPKRTRSAPPIHGLGFSLDPKGSLFYLLRDASKAVMSAFQQRIEKHQLTLGQYFILRELWQDDGLTQREISDRVSVMGPALTIVLDAMEERGFVTRVRSTEDRRRINVFVTEKGQSLRPIILGYSAEQHDSVLAGKSTRDVEFVRDFLISIRDNAHALRARELTA
jgi:MarR family transcriptional regulator, organic hydroperoxide resistance regulator